VNCEFEEKQFEEALNLHLVSKCSLFYAPGQVLEHSLGIDAALYSRSRRFWRLFPQLSPWHARLFGLFPEGIELRRDWWQDLNEDIEHFPPFKFNTFIQYKRPSYQRQETSAEWDHWRRPYFKYGLRPHQQHALEELASRIRTEGIVVYASPAFHKSAALWDAIKSGSLIDQTNFAEIFRLRDHEGYSYVSGGNAGLAHSEPEKIESTAFIQQIEKLRERRPELSNKETAIKWGEIVNSTAMENRQIRKTYQQVLKDLTEGLNESRLAVAFSQIGAFCFATGSICFIGIGPER
jgi:hypothetical protein